MATKTQAIQTLKKGDFFKIVTPEHTLKIDAKITTTAKVPERISKTVYVYDGYNKYGKCWNYHPFDDVNDDRSTKNKNKLVTTDFEF